MSDTTFSSGTVISSSWLNDVNKNTYGAITSAFAYGARGVSTVTDAAAIQAAVAVITALPTGGTVRVNSFISTSIDLTTLSIPSNVLIIDERQAGSGHMNFFSTNQDAEVAIYSQLSTDNEGPSFVVHNTNTTGKRTGSFASRYGTPTSPSVGAILHFGVWDGVSTWTPDFDFIGDGNFGAAPDFRSRVRIGAAGATILNPAGTGKNTDAAAAKTAGYSLIVNRPTPVGSGALQYQFGVKDGGVEVPQELQIYSANSTIRFQNAAQANKWGFVSEFPSAGQFTITDTVAGVNRIILNTGSATQFTGGIAFVAQTAASAPNDTLFKDSADGKLKFKDGAGVVNVLY